MKSSSILEPQLQFPLKAHSLVLCSLSLQCRASNPELLVSARVIALATIDQLAHGNALQAQPPQTDKSIPSQARGGPEAKGQRFSTPFASPAGRSAATAPRRHRRERSAKAAAGTSRAGAASEEGRAGRAAASSPSETPPRREAAA